METNINYKVFEGSGFPVNEALLDNITEEQRQLFREAMISGHYVDGIDVAKFLREDLTINLEKLELATILTVTALESNSPDDDVTLNLTNLDEYYHKRNVKNDEKKEREERTFLLSFVSSVASEASTRDTLIVKFV
jgi:hypothetical protein